jgi:hypothetical protein
LRGSSFDGVIHRSSDQAGFQRELAKYFIVEAKAMIQILGGTEQKIGYYKIVRPSNIH